VAGPGGDRFRRERSGALPPPPARCSDASCRVSSRRRAPVVSITSASRPGQGPLPQCARPPPVPRPRRRGGPAAPEPAGPSTWLVIRLLPSRVSTEAGSAQPGELGLAERLAHSHQLQQGPARDQSGFPKPLRDPARPAGPWAAAHCEAARCRRQAPQCAAVQRPRSPAPARPADYPGSGRPADAVTAVSTGPPSNRGQQFLDGPRPGVLLPQSARPGRPSTTPPPGPVPSHPTAR